MVVQRKEPFGSSDAKANVDNAQSDIDAIIEDIYESVGTHNNATGSNANDGVATGNTTTATGSAKGAGSAGKGKKSRAAGSTGQKSKADSKIATDTDAQAEGRTDAGDDLLASAQAEVEQYKERLVRLQAEWDNFRKRTAAERESERQRATANLVEQLLPVIDDLERAIEHSDTTNEEALKAGIAAVYNKLCDVLKKDGLKMIDPVGEAFDANIHQAVGKIEDDSVFDETVAQVYQKGYQMGDKVLRSAMVVVSQGGPKRPADDAKQGNDKQ